MDTEKIERRIQLVAFASFGCAARWQLDTFRTRLAKSLSSLNDAIFGENAGDNWQKESAQFAGVAQRFRWACEIVRSSPVRFPE